MIWSDHRSGQKLDVHGRFLHRSELGASAGGRERLRGGVSERTERLRSVASERQGAMATSVAERRGTRLPSAPDARSAAVSVRPPRSGPGISPPAPSVRFLRCPVVSVCGKRNRAIGHEKAHGPR
jgi:hypothetical protein